MSKFDKVDLAYDFLVKMENQAQSFTINELAIATGWKVQTCKTYPSKKWERYIARDGTQFTTTGIKFLSKEDFRNINSQKNFDEKPLSARSINLKKAREFALLAVATYNNPFTEFKTYGFVINIIIAYTALFHAIFEKRGTPYFYLYEDKKPKLVDGQEKAWELKRCCTEFWNKTDPAEKHNLIFLIGLRNIIEHRGLPTIDLLTFGECQAALNNFETLIINEFGDDNALMLNLALAMQLTRASQQAQIEAIKQIQCHNFEVVKQYIDDYKKELTDNIIESQQFRVRALLVPLVGKKAAQSDLAIEFINVNNLSEDELKKYDSGIAFIKGVENQFKLKPTKVVELVQKKIKDFNLSTHTKFWKFFNARPQNIDPSFKGEFASYVEGFDFYLYSDAWVKLIINTYRDRETVDKIIK